MNARQAVLWATRELSALPSPRLEAELLLCGAAGWEKHRLYLQHDAPLPPAVPSLFERHVARRKAREPLQHILGECGFLGRMFLCGPGALVPRPETEILLQAFLDVLPPNPSRLLDVGTGSGVVGISLSLAFPGAFVAGTDVSPDALRLAAANRRLHGADGFVPVLGDLAAPFRLLARFDGIVANLPYVASGEIAGLEPEVRDHEPREALDGGPDGLGLVRRLVAEAPPLLAPGGVLALELSPAQTRTVSGLLGRKGWSSVRTVPDLSGRDRVVLALRG